MSGEKFDPAAHLVNVSGRGAYLQVKDRLVWLRSEHADATIETEHIELTDERAVFRALVSIPSAGSATGYGSETADDFPGAHIEKAETKAIGRALAALGYGTQFCADFSEGANGADSPVEARMKRKRKQSRPFDMKRRDGSEPHPHDQGRDPNGPASERQRTAIAALGKQLELTPDALAQLAGGSLDALTFARAGDLITTLTNELRERGQARRER